MHTASGETLQAGRQRVITEEFSGYCSARTVDEEDEAGRPISRPNLMESVEVRQMEVNIREETCEDGRVELVEGRPGRVDYEEEVQLDLAQEWKTMVLQLLCSNRFWVTVKLVEPVASTGGWMIRRPPSAVLLGGNSFCCES